MISQLLPYWIWLSCACSTGTSKTDMLLEKFGFDAERIYRAERSDYAALGFTGGILQALTNKDLTQAEEIDAFCRAQNISVLTQAEEAYPAALKKISARPILLYVRGTLPNGDENLLCGVVGTRRMTYYGKRSAYEIGYDFAREGCCVVSGMASGIDGMAHRGCLDGGGKTVAVLGCGVNVCYPKEHEALKREIEENGAVISEYPPNQKPEAYFFPARNRIISGLCRAVAVIEADEKSGAMITARRALSQGKDLFALPGNVGEQNSIGTNRLIREGAHSFSCGRDITNFYMPLFSSGILQRIPKQPHKTVWKTAEPITERQLEQAAGADFTATESQAQVRSESSAKNGGWVELSDRKIERELNRGKEDREPARNREDNAVSSAREDKTRQARIDGLSPDERAVYEKLKNGDADPEQLADSGLSLIDVMTACTMLEIYGLIEGLPGGKYRLKA